MNLSIGSTIRRALPAAAVVGVLALSYMAQAPTLASSTNNCGVKGYGYHDHGKVCPNRPFPGHGKGISVALQNGATGSAKATETSTGAPTDETADSAGITTSDQDSLVTTSRTHGHGHGKAKGHSNIGRQ
jgi:hypothetical protein